MLIIFDNMKKQTLINFLETKYPIKNAEEWDFVGFSINVEKDKIEKVLICLDVNLFSVTKAIKEKVDLIISFHPFCFASEWEEIFAYDISKKKLVKQLIENQINVYSIHTNFDKSKKGTKYWFIKELKLEEKIINNYTFSTIVKFNRSFNSLIKLMKNNLKINNVITNFEKDPRSKINKIYFAPGAGNVYEFLKHNEIEKVDLLVTSDMKWNEQQLLNSIGIKYILIPHKTEDVFVKGLTYQILDKFPNLKIVKFKMNDFNKAF